MLKSVAAALMGLVTRALAPALARLLVVQAAEEEVAELGGAYERATA